MVYLNSNRIIPGETVSIKNYKKAGYFYDKIHILPLWTICLPIWNCRWNSITSISCILHVKLQHGISCRPKCKECYLSSARVLYPHCRSESTYKRWPVFCCIIAYVLSFERQFIGSLGSIWKKKEHNYFFFASLLVSRDVSQEKRLRFGPQSYMLMTWIDDSIINLVVFGASLSLSFKFLCKRAAAKLKCFL